ncbi:MAG: adenylate/guanylate cyclase domain-containing protein [Gemmatimonadales bacterium]
MIRFRLDPLAGGDPIPLEDGRTIVVGRGTMCEARLPDDTVSRHHAELRAGSERVSVRDLGSANGTTVNGRRTSAALAVAGDEIGFGRLRFRLAAVGPPRRQVDEDGGVAEDAVVRAVDVRSGGGPLARLEAERLAGLVELARRLSGEIAPERVIESVVELAAGLLPADRVAVLLLDPDGARLRLAATRSKVGATVDVSQSIAWRAIDERTAVTTEDAAADRRFQSGSVVMQRIRAALCVPLLADEQVLGALYLDSLTGRGAFRDDEAALAFAFAGLAAVTLAKAHWAAAARRQELARANLERYFAPAVAARIAGRVSAPRTGGERLPVAILFSDVRGFTRLAEAEDPEAVAAHLSEYFAAMVEIVFAEGGTLDKFIGDALLAVWGAPEPGDDDPGRALAAALRMRRRLRDLNTAWTAEGRAPLAVGIGLHAGQAFAGTIGSPQRLEYTVIGDVVNVASHLCDAAGPGEILVSGALLAALPAKVTASRADGVTVRGRSGPIEVWKVEEEQ